jgi:hypothetical protein
MDFRERYKRIGFGREDVELNRALRSQRRDEVRRELRTEHFNLKRRVNYNLDDSLEAEEREKDNASRAKPMNPEEEAKRKAAAGLFYIDPMEEACFYGVFYLLVAALLHSKALK